MMSYRKLPLIFYTEGFNSVQRTVFDAEYINITLMRGDARAIQHKLDHLAIVETRYDVLCAFKVLL